MKFELEEYHRGITDDELITKLKHVALKLNKTALNRAYNDDHVKAWEMVAKQFWKICKRFAQNAILVKVI